jgi:hypothetical protein
MSEPDDAHTKATAETAEPIEWEDVLGSEKDLPRWGFRSFELPDGQRFIALFFGQRIAEIELVEREVTLG